MAARVVVQEAVLDLVEAGSVAAAAGAAAAAAAAAKKTPQNTQLATENAPLVSETLWPTRRTPSHASGVADDVFARGDG